MGKIVLIIVSVVVVLAGALWYWTNGSSLNSPKIPSAQNANEQASPSTTVEEVNSVAVSDQSDGDVLVIDSAMLSKPSFIVIHKAKDGKPGTIVGSSSYLTAGTSGELDIDVSPVAKKGDIYFAMMHEDTNGNKKYDDEVTDMPVKDSKGNIVMVKFTITTSESQPASETPTEEE